jgi:hypothetical protein
MRVRVRSSPLIAGLGPAMALALAGCGAFAPATVPRTASRAGTTMAAAHRAAGTVFRADRTHEVPTPARPEHAARGWPAPEAAVRAFAAAYINWTAATVGRRLRALARDSVGQARVTLEVQAGEVASDRELRRGRIDNSGTVEAVAPLPGGAGRYVVVTRERTSAADDAAYRGLAPEWHVSVATVQRVGGRWVLSGWQPEN